MAASLLRVEDAAKRYAGVVALDGVSLDLHSGEVHALCGENGAGKSTLIKILGGAITPDRGQILMDGEEISLQTPTDSLARGIHIIYQEFHLVPYLNISQNIFLGREETRGGFLARKAMHKKARKLLTLIGADELDPDKLVTELRAGEQQLLEIIKALHGEVRVLIMDEPTASLTHREKERLFRIIENLKREDLAILFVSHQLDEVFEVADRISTIRDGKLVNSVKTSDTNLEEVTYWMLGKTIDKAPSKGETIPGQELLRVERLTRSGVFEDVSFSVRSGEVVGLLGLIGSGRTEILRALFGMDPIDGGFVYLYGQQVQIRNPEQAVRQGIALIPEDRKNEGLILGRPIIENFSLASLRRFAKSGWIQRSREEQELGRLRDAMKIKAPNLGDLIESLSGGNQQKMVLAKWLATQARIFLMDEPTHGVDVGAKVEIRSLIRHICEQGSGVLLVSSDIDEVLELIDRVLIIRKGVVVREFERGAATRDEILNQLLGANGQSRREEDATVVESP